MSLDHSTLCYLHGWLRSHRKTFQSRLIQILLLLVNFGNSTVLSLDIFGPESVAALLLFLINVFSVIFSLLGIYYYKAIFLIPNVVLKVMLSSSCLFYGLQLADSNDYSSACLFVWLLLSLVCFIWEIQAMFTATFGILKELNMKALSRPPPSYSQVVLDEIKPPSYADAVAMLKKQQTTTNVHHLDVEALERELTPV